MREYIIITEDDMEFQLAPEIIEELDWYFGNTQEVVVYMHSTLSDFLC